MENMKKNIYTCRIESLCCTVEIKHNTVNQLYSNKIFLKTRRKSFYPHGKLLRERGRGDRISTIRSRKPALVLKNKKKG